MFCITFPPAKGATVTTTGPDATCSSFLHMYTATHSMIMNAKTPPTIPPINAPDEPLEEDPEESDVVGEEAALGTAGAVVGVTTTAGS